jgi:hypothetical protein
MVFCRSFRRLEMAEERRYQPFPRLRSTVQVSTLERVDVNIHKILKILRKNRSNFLRLLLWKTSSFGLKSSCDAPRLDGASLSPRSVNGFGVGEAMYGVTVPGPIVFTRLREVHYRERAA